MADPRDEITLRLLKDAGIGAGMRVLDVGCGPGAVSFMIAQLVGERGSVVGLDREPRMLSAARERARELGLANVSFVEGDLAAPPPELDGFDAAVGRRVLMYQPDAAAALRALSRAVRPGGLFAFEEQEASMVPASSAPLPLHARVHGWMWRTVEREGGNLRMGLGLASALEHAGLVLEHVRAEAVVQTPRARLDIARIVRAMLPRMVERGVATEEEIDVETLDRRLGEELAGAGASYVGDVIFSAWGKKPG